MATDNVPTDHPSTTPPQRLGQTLRLRRKALGINMTAAAEAAGISRVTWHRLEMGEPSVAWGSLLAAAAVLGLQLRLDDGSERPGSTVEASLPLRIRLADYPGLRRVAWQVGEGVDALTPREAFGLYTRNARHLELESLSMDERALLRALSEIFGEAAPGV